MKRSNKRFEADATTEGDALVLDHSDPNFARVVVGCRSDEQAERIAAFLNHEFANAITRSCNDISGTDSCWS